MKFEIQPIEWILYTQIGKDTIIIYCQFGTLVYNNIDIKNMTTGDDITDLIVLFMKYNMGTAYKFGVTVPLVKVKLNGLYNERDLKI